MKKRILPALLALVMVLSLMPMSVFAAEPEGPTTITGWTEIENVIEKVSADGLTVKYRLLDNVQVTSGSHLQVAAGEIIELDLNGKTFTCGASTCINVRGALTLSGTGKIEAGETAAIQVLEAGRLVVNSGVTIETTGAGVCIGLYDNTATSSVTIDGATLISGGLACVYVNGATPNAPTVTIRNKANLSAAGYGCYLAGKGTTSITDSEVKGDYAGIEIRKGTLNVTDSTIAGGSNPADSNTNGNGPTSQNAGIAVANYSAEEADKITVNVNDGCTITGGSALYVQNPNSVVDSGATQAATARATITVDGENTTLKSTCTTEGANNAIEKSAAKANIIVKSGNIEGDVVNTADGNDSTGEAEVAKTSLEIKSGVTCDTPLDPETVKVPGFVADLGDGTYSYHDTTAEAIEAAGSADKVFAANAENIGDTETPATPVVLHKINILDAQNGTVTADVASAVSGETVTLTIAPASGYELDSIGALQGSTAVRISGTGDERTFTMPNADVTVVVTFKERTAGTAGFTAEAVESASSFTGYRVNLANLTANKWYAIRIANDEDFSVGAVWIQIKATSAKTFSFDAKAGSNIQVYEAKTANTEFSTSDFTSGELQYLAFKTLTVGE